MGVPFAIGVHAVLTIGHGQGKYNLDSSSAIGSSPPPDDILLTQTPQISLESGVASSARNYTRIMSSYISAEAWLVVATPT